jgi:hypothetical protein
VRGAPAASRCYDGRVSRIFYRLVESDPPTLRDFMSYAALGKAPPEHLRNDQAFLHRWRGLSVYDTYRAARRLAAARKFKRWAYVAELRIPDDGPIICEGPDDSGHWNLYCADPVYLKDTCLVRVVHAPSTVELSPGG